MTAHLVLVGMMGVGKTTVGRIVAARLGQQLVDSDAVIQAATGRTVREIFEHDGEAAFRVLERDALREALERKEPSVIVAAGGVVLDPDNRAALRESNARVVWLVGNVPTLVDRVGRADHRPLLDGDPAVTLTRMADEREALYREVADAIVSVEHRSATEVAVAVLR